MCGTKVQYNSYELAVYACRRLRRLGTTKDIELHAYKCPYCKQYHLGH